MAQRMAKKKEHDVDILNINELLREAGKRILMPAFQHQSSTARTKSDGSIVTDTDLECQRFIHQELAVSHPDIGFLGEEMAEEKQLACLKKSNRFWCLDPLDGTTNFVTSFPAFGTSLALVENGRPVLACIHDPIRDETFSAIRHEGAWLNGQPLCARSGKPLSEAVGFIDFKRLHHDLAIRLVTEKCCRSQRNLGSCALEWAWLAAGRAQFIIHGSEKLWDYAAGWLLAEEAACSASDFNQRRPFPAKHLGSSIAAASSPALHRQLLSLLNVGPHDS